MRTSEAAKWVSHNAQSIRRARLAQEQQTSAMEQKRRTRTTRWQWSEASVSQRLGWSAQTYSDFETGKRGVSVADLIALAFVFDVSPTALLMPPRVRAGSVIELVSATATQRLASASVREYVNWLRGLAPLPAQSARMFWRHFARVRNSVDRTDARQTFVPAGLAALSTGEPLDAEGEVLLRYSQVLDWYRRARGSEDFDEGLEHYRGLWEEAEQRLLGDTVVEGSPN